MIKGDFSSPSLKSSSNFFFRCDLNFVALDDERKKASSENVKQ